MRFINDAYFKTLGTKEERINFIYKDKQKNVHEPERKGHGKRRSPNGQGKQGRGSDIHCDNVLTSPAGVSGLEL